METSLGHFYQSGFTTALEGSLYVNDFSDDHPQVVELGHMKENACPESILNFILDADKLRKTQEDKLLTRCELGLPPDPHDWTVENVNAWLKWVFTTFDLVNDDDMGSKLQPFPWDGNMLAKWTADDFFHFFGPHGDLVYENFARWLNVSPESLEIQDNLFDVQKDINRLEDIKHRLLDTMVAQQPIFSQPFMKTEYGSNMSSPPLSPPMSDDFMSHDLDTSRSRSLPASEVSSTTLTCYPHAVAPGFSMVDDDIHPSSLFIEPESDGSGPPAVMRTKRRRGRPRKPKPPKQKRSQPILYKFILGHLNNPNMRDKLEWVNKQSGIFRFHSARKEEFAEMWGRYKGNREQMTYQNMARALRNYTRGKTKIMERVKRKLHYKFCPDFIQ
ncbi:uncharacterized protein LOC110975067 [Acanthaster planci]|uniref:Uncharacterized protein LOC110975067 n=1 Tax=Acanthaster planci TaxID=133434 RepID=A0A8B7XRQ6_ACAPL|nr:uncharacterized protein LOC110975067 [Acanthaster planci]